MMHFAGHILAALKGAARSTHETHGVSIDNLQQNAMDGIQQARVTLAGDPGTYRLILAPADAEIQCNGRPIGELFAKPLGER